MRIHERARLSQRDRTRARLAEFLALTKPRTIHLVVGAIPAMLLADRGVVHPLLITNTLVGAILMTAGANTLNCVADADIDRLMTRTADRPLARGSISIRQALLFGLALSIGSFAWLWWTTNLLTGLLAVATIVFYVVVYTRIIKRRTSQNVIWGGGANGMPVIIGWAAVTGTIGWQALTMFAIIFFWTPPHTWALAIHRNEDYQAAGVPMLPAVADDRHVVKQVLIFTWLTALATLLLALATGWVFDAVAVLAATWLVVTAHQLYARTHRDAPIEPMRLFQRCNIYLAVVFCALAVDSVVAPPNLLGR